VSLWGWLGLGAGVEEASSGGRLENGCQYDFWAVGKSERRRTAGSCKPKQGVELLG